MSWISAFIATTAGKTAAGAAVAAASVGGMHAADVVDLPILPDEASGPTEEVETTETPEPGDPVDIEASEPADTTDVDDTDAEGAEFPEEALEGHATAQAKQDAAEAFTTAMQDWADCVGTAAEAFEGGDDSGFDPVEACGDRPIPAEFGLTDLPTQAEAAAERAEDAHQRAEAGAETGDDARENRDDPTGGGENTPAPAGRP